MSNYKPCDQCGAEWEPHYTRNPKEDIVRFHKRPCAPSYDLSKIMASEKDSDTKINWDEDQQSWNFGKSNEPEKCNCPFVGMNLMHTDYCRDRGERKKKDEKKTD